MFDRCSRSYYTALLGVDISLVRDELDKGVSVQEVLKELKGGVRFLREITLDLQKVGLVCTSHLISSPPILS